MSAPEPVKQEYEGEGIDLKSSPGPMVPEEQSRTTFKEISTTPVDGDIKRRKTVVKAATEPKKPSEEVLQRRREGRIKAAATIAQNLKKTGIGRFEESNGFSLTSVKTIPLINQKNYFAEYLKKDEQVTMIRNWRREKLKDPATKNAGSEVKKAPEDEDEDDDDDENDNEEGNTEASRMGADTIVVHPGSQSLRIGRSTEAFPAVVPMVVGVRQEQKESDTSLKPQREIIDGEADFGSSFNTSKAIVTKDFKARMRYYKRRMMPNSRESAAKFNENLRPEVVPDNSDPDSKEYYDLSDPILKEKDFLIGQDALKLPISESFTSWRLRYPIVRGAFNQHSDDYKSQQEFLGDLIRLVNAALESIGIATADAIKYKCLLVIPDLYDKLFVETWVNLLLNSVGFNRVSIIQEAVASTFGCGVSCACVVDVGAQKSTVSCVDEGMIITDSRISLDYGGDDITEALTKLLIQQKFPCQDINLNKKVDDWELMDRIKRNFCTFDDAEVAVQLYNFHRKKVQGPTEKYNFKVYDEVMLAPLGLFYPDLFQISATPSEKRIFLDTYDQYTGEGNNPYSKAQENLTHLTGYADLSDEALLLRLLDDKSAFKQANAAYAKPAPSKTSSCGDSKSPVSMPLDKAIIESITNAGIATDFGKAKKLYDNLIIVGGGLAKFPACDILLNDRVNIWRPRYLSCSTLDDIMNYMGKERDKIEAKRKQMISDAKAAKKNLESPEEVELTDDELRAIDEECEYRVDLAKTDAIADQGAVIPVNVLPAAKEYDPQMIAWKGGSVYSRLKVINEMWITRDDWDLLSSRCIYYKSLFNY